MTAARLLWAGCADRWDEATLERAVAAVPRHVRERVRRYRRWQDAQMGLVGKLLLARCLRDEGRDPAVLERMTWSDSQRPALPVPGDFNLSHSGGLVACVRSPALRLGLDVEQVRPIDPREIARALDPRERRTLDAAADPTPEFFRIWTFKEAVLKADGRGMGLDLRAVDSLGGSEVRVGGAVWHLQRLALLEGYDAHLACDAAAVELEVRQVPVPELLG